MSDEKSLTQHEAAARADLLEVRHYDLDLDLTGLLDGTELRTTSVISFECRTEGADSFVECLGEVEEASLNGIDLPTGPAPGGRIALTGLTGQNTLVVRSVQRETGAGRGIQRTVDATDDRVYVWTTFEPDDAKVVYACFDQPDLKATFAVTVTAPEAWTVLSNGAPSEVSETAEGRRWVFPDTPRLSTYLPVVNAGPFHEVRTQRGGYDLGLYARTSLAGQLDRDADELFTLTADGLAFYGERFGAPFPQARYDQVFVPEFGGAMENWGCVTWSDYFIFREQPSYAERELRAVVLLHEMAHMWFGDLVTMVWWDDLWLNESFAEWACLWAATQITEFTDAWAGVLMGDKRTAYAADMAPTTHPIRQQIIDTAAAAASFDAITYPKGAAVLKQLVAYVGEDDFVAALGAYFAAHAWGNATLSDLVAQLERTSGRDLSGWVAGWLGTAGTDLLRLERSEDGLVLHAESPAGRGPLPHRLDVGVYDIGEEQLVRRGSIAVQVEGERTALSAVAEASVLVLNDDDLTFAATRPDDESLRRLIVDGGRFPTAMGRALAVTTVWDLLAKGVVRTEDFVRCVTGVLREESADSVIEPMLELASNAADYWSPAAERDVLMSSVADTAVELAQQPSRHLAAVRALARTATTEEQLSALEQLADSVQLRWKRLARLAELGTLDEAEPADLLAQDPDPDAWTNIEVVRAAAPDPQTKQDAWRKVVIERSLPVEVVGLVGLSFWRPGQEELLTPYRDAYLQAMPALGEGGMMWAMSLTGAMFPRVSADAEFAGRLVDAAGAKDLSPLVSKMVRTRVDLLERTLSARSR